MTSIWHSKVRASDTGQRLFWFFEHVITRCYAKSIPGKVSSGGLPPLHLTRGIQHVVATFTSGAYPSKAPEQRFSLPAQVLSEDSVPGACWSQFLAPTFSLLLLFALPHMICQWNISKDVLPIHLAALASQNWNNIPFCSSTLKIKAPSKHLSTKAGCLASHSGNTLQTHRRKNKASNFNLNSPRKGKYFHGRCIQNVQIWMDSCWIVYTALNIIPSFSFGEAV